MNRIREQLSPSKHPVLFAILTAATIILASANVKAQAVTSEFAAGLKAPVKLVATQRGNLFVAEAGEGPNTGRISIIDSAGNRRTLVDGLPSAINQSPGGPEPSGPSGLDMRGRTIFVTIGQGDAVMAGPVPGSETINPNPSSPLFSAVLSVRLGPQGETTAGGFALTSANRLTLKLGGAVTLTNASGDELRLETVADFRDFTFEPLPDFPGNVRASNPFGVAASGNLLYVVDASQNLVREVNVNTGDTRILATFARKPNPLPFGPPVIDPVPDNIRLFGKQLLVTFLTGFPFPAGQAEVRKINRVNNSQRTFIGGLNSAIDVLPAGDQGAQDRFFVLEFSANMLANAPGRLLLFDSPSGAPTVIAGNLITPTSMAINPADGALYVTEIFTGRIIKVQ